MTTAPGGTTWHDLGRRTGSAIALAGAGMLAALAGGAWFAAFAIAIGATIAWEMSVIAGARRPARVALATAAASALLVAFPSPWLLVLLFLPALAGRDNVRRVARGHAVFCALCIVAVCTLVELRATAGIVWLVWFVCVVIATDVAGYFAGRALGGPKCWPQLSPKKTWSGTCAGWVAAAGVGAAAMGPTEAGLGLVAASVALSMASQAGDVAESAMKRAGGAKDSSDLLPGHGGFFDRFDGVIGAAALLVAIDAVTPLLPGPA